MPATNVVRTRGAFKDPKTKSDFIDRMMSREFSGDLRDLAVNQDLRMERAKPNVLSLHFGTSGQDFEMVIRKPRGPRPIKVKAGRGKRLGKVHDLKTGAVLTPESGAHPSVSRKGNTGKRNTTRGRKSAGGASHASH
jgi:hypothetical protein